MEHQPSLIDDVNEPTFAQKQHPFGIAKVALSDSEVRFLVHEQGADAIGGAFAEERSPVSDEDIKLIQEYLMLDASYEKAWDDADAKCLMPPKRSSRLKELSEIMVELKTKYGCQSVDDLAKLAK
jgi:hypothetical protein